MPPFRRKHAQPGDREEKAQVWRDRIMRGTEKSPDEELREAQDVLDWALRKHPADSPFAIKAMLDVANQLAQLERVAEEADLREQIVEGLRTNLGSDNLGTASAQMTL